MGNLRRDMEALHFAMTEADVALSRLSNAAQKPGNRDLTNAERLRILEAEHDVKSALEVWGATFRKHR